MEVDNEDGEKASTVAAAQQQTGPVVIPRKHARGEDLLNGVSSGGEKASAPEKKRRRKTAASTTPAPAPTPTDRQDRASVDGESTTANQASEQPLPIEEIRPVTNGCSIGVQVETTTEISPSDAIVLGKDEPRLNRVVWSPKEGEKLVSGPQGAYARIWSIPDKSEPDGHVTNITLDHPTSLVKRQEVTAVQWSPDGTILATGTFDGNTRLWKPSGSPIAVFPVKCSPILTLRWNKTSTVLLSLHIDGGLLAWDIKAGELFQNFEGKIEATDMIWLDNETFAACGAQGEIIIFSAITGSEVGKMSGDGLVGSTCLSWDEVASCLASGDKKGKISVGFSALTNGIGWVGLTWAQIWKEKRDTQVIQAHDTAIEQLIWQPIRAGTPTEPLPFARGRLLASTAQDAVIKLWSIDNSATVAAPTLVHTFPPHDSVKPRFAFSPDGTYLASGSCRKVNIWRVEDGFLEYVYDPTKQEDTILTNGDVNGNHKEIPAVNGDGDIDMGGTDEITDGDSDSGKGVSFSISDISWDKEGKMVAVAMVGLGVRGPIYNVRHGWPS